MRSDPQKLNGFHLERRGAYFFIIGAHFKNQEPYQVLYKFKLDSVDEADWKARDIETLDLADQLFDHYPKNMRASVEGLAVTTAKGVTRLFMGLRTNPMKGPPPKGPNRLRIVEFRTEGGIFEAFKEYDLAILPKRPERTGPNYHLSGLTYLQGDRLVVLASTEGAGNRFHGNRIFVAVITDGRLDLDGASPNFAKTQKAEGITVWKDGDCGWRAALVFDNDLTKSDAPSRIFVSGYFQSPDELIRRGMMRDRGRAPEDCGKELGRR